MVSDGDQNRLEAAKSIFFTAYLKNKNRNTYILLYHLTFSKMLVALCFGSLCFFSFLSWHRGTFLPSCYLKCTYFLRLWPGAHSSSQRGTDGVVYESITEIHNHAHSRLEPIKNHQLI